MHSWRARHELATTLGSPWIVTVLSRTSNDSSIPTPHALVDAVQSSFNWARVQYSWRRDGLDVKSKRCVLVTLACFAGGGADLGVPVA
eukprot:11202600-Karenia_brevis.AAC.1